MSLIEDAVHERMQTSRESGTSCRWPFCRSYDEIVVVQTAAHSALNNNLPRAIRADVLTQKMRDQKTTNQLKSAASIFSTILLLGFVLGCGRQWFKWHRIK